MLIILCCLHVDASWQILFVCVVPVALSFCNCCIFHTYTVSRWHQIVYVCASSSCVTQYHWCSHTRQCSLNRYELSQISVSGISRPVYNCFVSIVCLRLTYVNFSTSSYYLYFCLLSFNNCLFVHFPTCSFQIFSLQLKDMGSWRCENTLSVSSGGLNNEKDHSSSVTVIKLTHVYQVIHSHPVRLKNIPWPKIEQQFNAE